MGKYKSYGRDVLNPVAYETGNEDIADGYADNGGNLSSANKEYFTNIKEKVNNALGTSSTTSSSEETSGSSSTGSESSGTSESGSGESGETSETGESGESRTVKNNNETFIYDESEFEINAITAATSGLYKKVKIK